MTLDSRLDALFQQSVGSVDGFLRSFVPALVCPKLCLRDGAHAVDDFLERYDSHLKASSRRTRNEVLACIAREKQMSEVESEQVEAFVMPGLFDVVYYTPVLFERNSIDVEFEYTFCHEALHARHYANYSRFKKNNPDDLLLSFFDTRTELSSEERDECLVDCTMGVWFEVDENRLTPLVRKHGLSYVWRMALNHEVWEKF